MSGRRIAELLRQLAVEFDRLGDEPAPRVRSRKRPQQVIPPDPEELGNVTDLERRRVRNAALRKGHIER